MMRFAVNGTRRNFLGAAAGSIAFPTIVPSTVFGTQERAAPSERVTLGFIGCGKMAHDFHLSTLLGFSDVQALAVCDVDTTRRNHAQKLVQDTYEKAGRASKTCDAYNDFRDLLAANWPLVAGLGLLAIYLAIQVSRFEDLAGGLLQHMAELRLHRVIEAFGLLTLLYAALRRQSPENITV